MSSQAGPRRWAVSLGHGAAARSCARPCFQGDCLAMVERRCFFNFRVNPLTAQQPTLSPYAFARHGNDPARPTGESPVRDCAIRTSPACRFPFIAAETTSAKNSFFEPFQSDHPAPAYVRKIALLISENHYLRPPVPPHCRGASRPSRTLKRDAGRAGDAGRASPARTVKSCGPGLPTLRPSSQKAAQRAALRATGARKPGSRGDHV
jgi:hypothetical protein